eukprot:m.81712 g.81712  ORF g.81712 m.81712 type:complete len:89 (-) comp20999_c0_seq3:88-354(-)
MGHFSESRTVEISPPVNVDDLLFVHKYFLGKAFHFRDFLGSFVRHLAVPGVNISVENDSKNPLFLSLFVSLSLFPHPPNHNNVSAEIQ